MSSPQLEIRNLSCQRGERMLFSELHFGVSEGQAMHIAGPNGCGKSSLLRQICGLAPCDSGDVLWQNTATKGSHQFKQALSYIGHKDGLKNELTAFENLQFYQSLNAKSDVDRIDDALEQMQILHCAEQPTHQLSFGQRRRLAFARLMLHFTPLWILDEPFTGIDQSGRELLTDLLLAHLKNGGIVLLTNHGDLQNTAIGDHLNTLDLRQFRPKKSGDMQ